MDNSIQLSVIIVNYRVKYFLAQTLHSVIEALEDIPNEIYVVDNNSGDDSVEYSKKLFPNVIFIENKENTGFAKANNQAINLAKGKYCLILNPDTVITREAISAAIAKMESDSKCGAIGTKMIDGNGVFLPESKRAFPTPWVSFCKIFGLSKLFPMSPRFARYHLRYLSEKEEHKIEIMAGAYMVIRTGLLQKIDGFDESFFMYGEDIDLSYRITLKGYDNWYLPQPIIHYKGESTKKDSFKYVQVFYDAMLIFFRKHYPNYSAPYYIFVKTGIFVRAGVAMIKRAVGRLFGRKKQEIVSGNNWLLISDNAEDLKERIRKNYGNPEITEAENIPENCNATDILLDGRYLNYSQIVATLNEKSKANRNFHIYSSVCGVIITPKMNVL